MFAFLALVGLHGTFDTPPNNSEIADFVVLEELELDSASQPERLFVLRDVILGDLDPAFGGALTVTGIISYLASQPPAAALRRTTAGGCVQQCELF